MENRAILEPILFEKIRTISDDVLPDLINIIDNFKNLTKNKHEDANNEKSILDFAGAWSDFQDYDEFIKDIYKRRSNFISRESL